MNKKLLIVFSNKFSSNEMAEKASKEIKLITNSSNVSYCYDKSNSYFSFYLSEEDYEVVEECFHTWLGEDDINYLMVSTDDRNNICLLPESVYHMLHKMDIDDIEDEEVDEKMKEKFFTSKDNERILDFIEFINEESFDDESDLELIKIKNKKKEKTIDEILDKINSSGIKSLTEEELKVLKRKAVK